LSIEVDFDFVLGYSLVLDAPSNCKVEHQIMNINIRVMVVQVLC
jgi:hypothetical protein